MGKLELLFVEDDPDIQDVIILALRLDLEIELTAFETATDALQTLAGGNQQFPYALLDMRLPGMTGVQLHQELRKLPGMADLRSVIITAAPQKITAEDRSTPGIMGVLAKPFDVLTLAAEVRALFTKGGK